MIKRWMDGWMDGRMTGGQAVCRMDEKSLIDDGSRSSDRTIYVQEIV